jgi:PAS domain S-box-containing protein
MLDSYLAIEGIKQLLGNSTVYYMVSVGMDSNFSYVNRHYANTFRFIDEDIVGKPYDLTMHPDDTMICQEVGAKCFANPENSYPATIRKRNGKGGYIVTQWDYRLIVRNGQPEGIFCLGHDITEFESLKKNFTDLQKNMDESQKILFNIAYEQSHIVRAPVANILGLVSILKTMELDHNLRSIIGMLSESTDRLDDVVRSTIHSIHERPPGTASVD